MTVREFLPEREAREFSGDVFLIAIGKSEGKWRLFLCAEAHKRFAHMLLRLMFMLAANLA